MSAATTKVLALLSLLIMVALTNSFNISSGLTNSSFGLSANGHSQASSSAIVRTDAASSQSDSSIKPYSLALTPLGGGTASDPAINYGQTPDSVVASIHIDHPGGDTMYDPDNGGMYVSSPQDNLVSVINSSTNEVVATIQVPCATGMAYDKYNHEIFVEGALSCNSYGSPTAAAAVWVVDGNSNSVLMSIPIDASYVDGPIIFNPADRNAYLDVYAAGSVDGNDTILNKDTVVINATSNTVFNYIGSIVVNAESMGIGEILGQPVVYQIAVLFLPGEIYGYVQFMNENGVIQDVYLPSCNVGGTSVPGSAFDLVYDPDNQQFYASSPYCNQVVVLDPSIQSISVPIQPGGLAYDSENKELYVWGNGAVSVIDTNTNAVIDTISVNTGGPPANMNSGAAMAFDAANGEIYVGPSPFEGTDSGTCYVYSIDGSTNLVAAQIGIPCSTDNSAFPADNSQLSQYDPTNGDIYFVDYYTDTVSAIFTGPLTVTVDPTSGNTKIQGSVSTTVSVFYSSSKSVNLVISPCGSFQVSWFSNGSPGCSTAVTALPSGAQDDLELTTTSTTKPGTYLVNVTASIPGGPTATATCLVSVYGFKVQLIEQGLPSGTQWNATLDGKKKAITTTSTIEFDNVSSGLHSWTVLTPITTSSPGERYASVGSGSIFVEGDVQQNIQYTTEYLVAFSAANPSGSGSTTPSGSNWYNASSSVPIVAKLSSGYAFSSWSPSSNLVLLNSISSSTTMTVNGPGTIGSSFYPIVSIVLNSSTVEVAQGTTVVVGSVISGGTQSVSVSFVGLQTGFSASLSSTSFTNSPAGVTDNLTILAATAAAQTYSVTVYADGANGQTASASFKLVVFSASNTVTIQSPKGRGTVMFSTSAGQFVNITDITQGSLSTIGEPSGVSFPFGLFTWSVTGIPAGSTITVTMTFQYNIPTGAKYWKYDNGNWVNATSLLSGNNGGSALTLTIKDGGLGDTDGLQNGEITDPGGLALNLVTSPGSSNAITGMIGVGSVNAAPGTSPGSFAYDSTNGYLYVIPSIPFSSLTTSVYVINPVTQAVIDSIPNIDGSSPFGILMTFDSKNGEMYVASDTCQSCFSSVVYAIDTASNVVAQTITPSTSPLLAYDPSAIGFDPVNGYVYVGGYSSSGASAVVSVIDGSTNNVIDSISLGSTSNIPVSFAFDSSTGNIYAALANSSVVIIDGATSTLTSHVSGVQCCTPAAGLAFDSSNGNIYLVQQNGDNVSVISTATNSVVAFTIVNILASAINFDSFNGNIYVASYYRYTSGIAVIDGSSNKLAATLSFDSSTAFVSSLASNPTNGDVYALSLLGSIYVISGTTNTLAGTLGVGNIPTALAFDSLNGDIYVASLQSDTVSVINGATDSVIANVTIPAGPYALAFDSLTGNVYVADQNGISVIDGTTNTIVDTPFTFPSNSALAISSNSILFDPANGVIYFGYISVPSPTSISTVIIAINGATNSIVSSTSYPGIELISMVLDSSNGNIYSTAYCPLGCSGVVPVVYSVVNVISTTTNAVVASVRVGDSPDGLAFDPANGDIYVANSGDSYLSVIDGSTNTVVANATILCSGNPCGYGLYHHPTAATFDSSNGDIYVADADGSVAVISGTTNAEIALLQPGIVPKTSILFDAANSNIYVTGGIDSYVCEASCLFGTTGSGFVTVISTTEASPLLSPVQYPVTFLQAGAGENPTVTYSLSNGTSGSAETPFTIYMDAFPQVSLSYTYDSTVQGTVGTQYVLTTTTPTSPQDVNGILQITGTYETQYLVTFSQIGLDSTAQGTIASIGSSQFQLNALPFSEYVDSGSTIDFSYSNPVSSSNPGERFALTGVDGADSLSSITATSPSAVSGVYGMQFQVALTVSPSGSGAANLNPSDTWYDASSVVQATATNNAGYAFSSWSTPGLMPVQDQSLASTSVTINGPGTIQANFGVETYAVTFLETGLPTGTSWSVTFNGNTQSSTGSSIQFSGIALGSYDWRLDSPIAGGQGTRYLASTSSGTMDVFSNPTESIVYITQYQASIVSSASAGGSTIPSGTGWHTAGVQIGIKAAPATGYAFLTWSSSTSQISIVDSSKQDTMAIINGPGTITAGFQLAGSTITFAESGLPSGATWSVDWAGTSYQSTGGTLTISDVAAGSYPWEASTPASCGTGCRIVPMPDSGTMAVDGTTNQATAITFYTQYDIGFSYSIVDGGNPTAPTLTYVSGGVTQPQATLTETTTQFWLDNGSTWSVTNPLTSSSSSERWATASDHAVVSSSQTVSLDYYHQFLEGVSYTLATDSSVPSSSPALDYYYLGLPASIKLPTGSSNNIWADAGTAAGASTVTAASGTERWIPSPASWTITAANVITDPIPYYHQFEASASYSTSDSSTVSSAVTLTATQLGSTFTVPLSLSSQNIWLDAKSWSVTDPVIAPSGAEKWDALTGISGAVTGPIIIDPLYYHQYLVSFATSPQGGGSTTPSAASWYNASSTIEISAAASSGYEFQKWSTNNPSIVVSSFSTPLLGGASTVATIGGAGTLTANFAPLPAGMGAAIELTDSSLCSFDTNASLPGQQFNLLYTPEKGNSGLFDLTSSNPGQLFLNIFYVGTPGTQMSLDVAIPYPFVTQGAEPIQFYGNVSITNGGCFSPSDSLSGFSVSGVSTTTPSGALSITMSDYNSPAFGSKTTITVEGTVPSSGLVYITVHLDYGLEGTSGYQQSGGGSAASSSITIANTGSYDFAVDGATTDLARIYNQNLFK